MTTHADLAEPPAVSAVLRPHVLRPAGLRPHLALNTELWQSDVLGPLVLQHLVVQVPEGLKILLLIL